MKKRKLNSNQILKYLIDYLIMSLDELTYTNTKPLTGFAEGTVAAFLECLEILGKWKKFGPTDFTALESRYCHK